jgi:hypothetical protein
LHYAEVLPQLAAHLLHYAEVLPQLAAHILHYAETFPKLSAYLLHYAEVLPQLAAHLLQYAVSFLRSVGRLLSLAGTKQSPFSTFYLLSSIFYFLPSTFILHFNQKKQIFANTFPENMS